MFFDLSSNFLDFTGILFRAVNGFDIFVLQRLLILFFDCIDLRLDCDTYTNGLFLLKRYLLSLILLLGAHLFREVSGRVFAFN